jgi:integrase
MVQPEHLGLADAAALRNRLIADYAPGTANRLLAVTRCVLRAAWRLDLISKDTLDKLLSALFYVKSSRMPRGRSLSWPLVEKLIAAGGSNEERALLALMVGCGLRRAEIPLLTWGRVDWRARGTMLRVIGKGNKERLVRIPEWAREHLEALNPRHQIATDLPIFRWRTGAAVRVVVVRTARAAGIGHVSAHDLRRTYFDLCRSSGLDLATIRRSMGHASILTTIRYDKRSDDSVQAEMAALDDLAKRPSAK